MPRRVIIPEINFDAGSLWDISITCEAEDFRPIEHENAQLMKTLAFVRNSHSGNMQQQEVLLARKRRSGRFLAGVTLNAVQLSAHGTVINGYPTNEGNVLTQGVYKRQQQQWLLTPA